MAWVQVPTLSYTANTSLYVYYGNSSASNPANPEQRVGPHYKGVWHLSETSGNFNDSTWEGIQDRKFGMVERPQR